MNLQGTIKLIKDVQHVSDKFRKRDFIITTDETTPYPQHILIELTQDKTELINNYNVGDKIKVDINIKGCEWNGPQGIKYFNTIQGWRIELVSQGQANQVANNTNDDMQF